MEISIKGMYSLMFMAFFVLLIVSLLVLNINYYQLSKITLSIVDNIQNNNGLDQELNVLINDYAENNGVDVLITEINFEDGKRYKVTVKYEAEIMLLAYKKEFIKTRVTRMLY